MEESRKATAESTVTSNAENHSHHSWREILCGLKSAGWTRKLPEPSRGEGFGLRAERPRSDFILRTVELGCHHCSRAWRGEATAKTYRLARFKNLPIRAGAAKRSAKVVKSRRTT